MFVKRLIMLMAILALSGCGMTMSVQDFKMQKPGFALERYFDGKLIAHGLFEDRFGNVRNQFTVNIDGTWDGKTLTLDEHFAYLNGETEERVWTVVKTGPDSYRGSTKDTIGDAIGQAAGNSFNWAYKINLKVGDDHWKVKFDDWMFLQPDGTVLNKATVYRWGFKIGTVFISFRKQSD